MKNGEYEMVVAPNGYTGKKYRNRYCYEHHLVWWIETGACIKNNQIIHHVNGNKRDNRFENLELMSIEEHNRHHSPGKEMTELKCSFCGNSFNRETRRVKSKMKNGQVDFYCNRNCQAKHFGRGRKKYSRVVQR